MIDVWRIDLGEETLDELGELLCVDERARAARLVRERDRVLWTRSRGASRMLLGRYLDRDPRQLRFVFGPYGKPALAAESRALHGLRFNLSHSGELMLLAVTTGNEIGVDVERARERYEASFLREWTKREAIVKCSGTGLARARIDLDVYLDGSLDIDLDGGRDLDSVEGRDAPWTAEVDVGEGAFAAVAVANGPCELRPYSQ